MSDIVCLGEALIDFVAAEPCSDVGMASGFLRAPGGAPANVAVGAARLGVSSAFLGKVGDDPFGRFLGRTFSEAGVDVRGMVFDPIHRTGLAFVSLAQNGERDFCFFRNPSADMTYSAEEVDLDAIDGCRIFHFGSITLIDAEAKQATVTAVKRAKSTGKLISYDPNLRPPLWRSLSEARATILEGARWANLVKVSEEELGFLLSQGNELPVCAPDTQQTAEFATRFLQQYENVSVLAVTCGALGCQWWTAAGSHGSHPGYKVRAVDTTGAGDGFVAGLLTGMLSSGISDGSSLLDLEEAALNALFSRANAVGAITTTIKGAIPALPTADALAEFIGRS